MVLCWIALPVFAFLGIFSAKYRNLTKESLECLFRTATLRKCKSGLDDRIKSDITGKLLRFSPKLGKVFYKNYKLLTWILLIIFIWSGYVGIVGFYNFVNYGNCNGPDSTGFCLLDPTGANSKISELGNGFGKEIVLPVLEDDDPIIGPKDAELTIIEFGCFTCPYTKKSESTVKKIIEYYDGRVNFQFKNMILPTHELSFDTGLASDCALEQGNYNDYHDRLFEMQSELVYDDLFDIAKDIGLDSQLFDECLRSKKYSEEVKGDNLMGLDAGVHGTPTFFINDKIIVGPKPFKTFKKIIDGELR